MAVTVRPRQTTVEVRLATVGEPNGRRVVLEAFETNHPCLVVHKDATGWPFFAPPGWTITHRGSGLALRKHIKTRRAAIAAANELADMADWSLPTKKLSREIKSVEGRLHAMLAVLNKYGGSR